MAVETKRIEADVIAKFLQGRDPMEHIVSIECGYTDEKVSIVFINDEDKKMIRRADFKPFIWAKKSVAVRMFGGDRKLIKSKLNAFKIGVKALNFRDAEGNVVSDRLENGYKYLFYAKEKMTYNTFLKFFTEAGTPIYSKTQDSNKEFLSVAPVEQYMMYSGRRMFKGYESYDDLKRLMFDLETQGLNPQIHGIDQIGIRTNKGFERVITVEGEGIERDRNEMKAIIEFLTIIKEEAPDVIAGHNSENFDWQFIMTRCEVHGISFENLTERILGRKIYKRKKQAVLKLGGEVEYYYPTMMWGTNIIDSLHAVRRAQAIDSSMKLANLKYVTKYLSLNKKNRVYVKGNQIGTIWRETENVYAFNNTNGDYYKISEEKPLQDGYEPTSGRYIVERYLLDDIWETDKVELKLNETNFLLNQIVPTTFQRACTMGTAAAWKLLVLAWYYEQGLAVPAFGEKRRFTGGLSRLLRVGYVDNIVKLDFNSLYPSIILTWDVKTDLDVMNVMLSMLDYILTEREKYKGLKKKASKNVEAIAEKLKNFNGTKEEREKLEDELQYWEADYASNDKKQAIYKIFGNSFFGSYGSGNLFMLGDADKAEFVTCTGRQSLRLMISWFTKLGYTPIVGDSFLGDTPLFVKYDKNNIIDIRPISELINEREIKTDLLNREYDYSEKDYKVLCRSGWVKPSYIYRHKTYKDIYEVTDGDMQINVTEDHSLYDKNKKELNPKNITEKTELEYYEEPLKVLHYFSLNDVEIEDLSIKVANGELDRVPIEILNTTRENMSKFLSFFQYHSMEKEKYTKTCLAGIQYLFNHTMRN